MNRKLQKHIDLLKKDETIFLNFLKAKFPVFHNSNFFFRDFQYGIRSFLEKKEIKASYQMAEKLAEDMAKYYEVKNLFVKINHQAWKINKQEFVTAEPGD